MITEILANVLLYGAILVPIGYLLYMFFTSSVVRAVFQRNFMSFFLSPIGYLIVFTMVVACAVRAFDGQFFTNNLANLDRLTESFPFLLLFIVPAITMSCWSEEKRQGTDELLFTLPSSDTEILLGKFLAACGVYTVAMAFLSMLWIVLAAFLADPGLGLYFTTYFGYWLAGISMIALGMFASILTKNTTVAFVLGATFGAIVLFLPQLVQATELVLGSGLRIIGVVESSSDFSFNADAIASQLSIQDHLRDFSSGVIPARGMLYFVSLTCIMLYLNLIAITKRHWSRGRSLGMSFQFAVRVVCVAVVLFSLNVVASQANARFDMTPQRYFTLNDTTIEVIDNIEPERPVTVQAFLSKDVPREYVAIRKRLVGLLKDVDQRGGALVRVRFVDVEPFSEEADQAKVFGIEPRSVTTEQDGRYVREEVYLGLVFSSTYDEVVVPFISSGTPLEYEITRSLRTVSNAERLTVGVLTTDAGVMQGDGGWDIVTELKLQYEVESVSPSSDLEKEKKLFSLDAELAEDLSSEELTEAVREKFASEDVRLPATVELTAGTNKKSWTMIDPRTKREYRLKLEDEKAKISIEKDTEDKDEEKPESTKQVINVYRDRYDVLLAVLPSSLVDAEMDNLVKYIESGRPCLIFDDPMPQLRPDLAPSQPKPNPMAGMMMGRQPPPAPPKADGGTLRRLMDTLGMTWKHDEIVWDTYNPIREIADLPREYIFAESRPAATYSVNQESDVTKGVGRIVLIDCGSVYPKEDAEDRFEFTRLLRSGPVSGKLNWKQFTTQQFTFQGPVVRRVREVDPGDYVEDELAHLLAVHITTKKKTDKRNVIFVADTDMIANGLYSLKYERPQLQLENSTFVLNAVDVLAGETSFLELRRRKESPSSLKEVERQLESFRAAQQKQIEAAKDAAKKEQEAAQKSLDDKRKAIEESDLPEAEKEQQKRMAQAMEQVKLNRTSSKIDQKMERQIEEAKAVYQRNVRIQERRFQFVAVLLASVPVVCLGMIFLGIRMMNENRHISPDRRRR